MAGAVDEVPRFLCDEMLQHLSHWLRAAGYDTTVAEAGEADREVLARAVEEGRWLLTRDCKLLEHRLARGRAVLLESDALEGQMQECRRHFGLNWLYRPFSRCLVCNTPLQRCHPPLHELPPSVRHEQSEFFCCEGCGRYYWEGSHVRRMRAWLEAEASVGND